MNGEIPLKNVSGAIGVFSWGSEVKVCIECGERFEGDGWNCPRCGKSPRLCAGYLSLLPNLAETREGFNADYFTQLAALEHRHFWFQSRNRLLIWALRRFFPSAKSFLEIGCGTGFVLSEIQRKVQGLALSGSDVLIDGLAFAEKRLSKVTLFQMDAHFIPFREEFDVIGAFDVLEHIEDDEEVLSQLFKAIKRGGGLMVTVPQHPTLWSYIDDYSFHKRRYRRRELVKKVHKSGFQGIWCTSFVTLLFPLMFLIRLGKKRSPAVCNPLEELRLSIPLNNALLRIMYAENFLIRRGFSFSVGGSLLLVAKKQ